MGTVWIKEFRGGLDSRRMVETASAGVLIEGLNGHITRGGEFESRAAFVKEYELPEGTVGMGYTRTGIVVFGSVDEPDGIPDGITYQKLTPPGDAVLLDVPSFDLYSGKIYAVGVFSDGSRLHFYDGVQVEDWADGRARASFTITGGTSSGTASTITSITANGVEILGSTVTWDTSHEVTAAAVAAQINLTSSTPEYTAVSSGATVVILYATSGTTINDAPVLMTLADGFAVAPSSGLVMAGGADSGDGFTPGGFVRTIRSKMYSTSGPNMHFSGIQAPTQWTTEAAGAGFVDLSSYSSGAEELKALASYQGQVAVFAETGIQVWYVDPDPLLNRQTQELGNTGTVAANSVTQFGDNDLFYLDTSGCRSLRARDASNAASTTDIGSAIDTLISAKVSALSAAELEQVSGLIAPGDSRFWLVMKDVIYVFTYFPSAKVSAWTQYSTVDDSGEAFTAEQALAYGRKVYIRGGNSIYVYGGLGSGTTYDSTEAVARTPYLDADWPTRKKGFQGIDAALRGQWSVYAGHEPEDTNAKDKIAVLDHTTFTQQRISYNHSATHISLTFKSKGVGPHKLGACVIHHDLDDAED
ncbi:hypothetical protein OEG84_11455 [Hoeflea sp. G2-23]|uniref:Uncharacterized protein n=1 Tax=Hoeflea algicola TaxID=2983763 RepID=A0ABT3ZAE9_9HYPH|nr:hypothetical protein [Hoeflea algicola]MCY0148309.1 hypothetical protein [Hoeflea algicola]